MLILILVFLKKLLLLFSNNLNSYNNEKNGFESWIFNVKEIN